MPDRYEVKRFRTAPDGSPDTALASAWVKAVGSGFHDSNRNDTFVDKILAMYRTDDRELTGIYQAAPVAPHSLGPDVPVATFATLRKDLNIGYGRQLETQLVTAVTVRGTHRRQGLLRRMMTEDLGAAKAAGVALAALTASEGSIYGRFGFGVATFERSIKVDTGPRFRIRHAATGSVEMADRRVLLDLAAGVFDRVHRLTPGSIVRQEAYRHTVSGAFGRDGSEDDAIRCALHYDASGRVDGYASYRFAGWDAKPYTIELVDLVAATGPAYLELWQFLGAIDLSERVSWESAPVDDPLAWALEDPRCIESADQRDMLWLRILDAGQALAARRFSADGTLVLEVADTLGLAGGTYVLNVSGGDARVVEAPPGTVPDLSLGVAELGSIYLGGVSPVILAESGRILEHTPGAAFRAALMFAVERPPHCLTHF
ncbi:GNAT family N-acetyltransferase [Arthrobacter sp. NPDC057388]|uniref:GNAT family N-acetyltransferase n=1 Tax=Arthrobacter sp. NPDC057388 TaxID=3346116 RepID=UPI003625F399